MRLISSFSFPEIHTLLSVSIPSLIGGVVLGLISWRNNNRTLLEYCEVLLPRQSWNSELEHVIGCADAQPVRRGTEKGKEVTGHELYAPPSSVMSVSLHGGHVHWVRDLVCQDSKEGTQIL